MARTRKSLAQGLVGAQELPLLDLVDQPHPSWLARDRTCHGHLFPPDASTKLGITYTLLVLAIPTWMLPVPMHSPLAVTT